MVKEGWYSGIPALLLALLCFSIGGPLLATLGVFLVALSGLMFYFFRDPERRVDPDPSTVVSPADGKVIRLTEGAEGKMISIFLSVLDVHVNRAPIRGRIAKREYRPGRFKLAWDESASVENEQVVFTLEGDREISFSLVAGLLARRIVPWKEEGELVEKGERIALIRFGSRADVYLPPNCEVAVQEGARVYGGTSVIARWREV